MDSIARVCQICTALLFAACGPTTAVLRALPLDAPDPVRVDWYQQVPEGFGSSRMPSQARVAIADGVAYGCAYDGNCYVVRKSGLQKLRSLGPKNQFATSDFGAIQVANTQFCLITADGRVQYCRERPGRSSHDSDYVVDSFPSGGLDVALENDGTVFYGLDDRLGSVDTNNSVVWILDLASSAPNGHILDVVTRPGGGVFVTMMWGDTQSFLASVSASGQLLWITHVPGSVRFMGTPVINDHDHRISLVARLFEPAVVDRLWVFSDEGGLLVDRELRHVCSIDTYRWDTSKELASFVILDNAVAAGQNHAVELYTKSGSRASAVRSYFTSDEVVKVYAWRGSTPPSVFYASDGEVVVAMNADGDVLWHRSPETGNCWVKPVVGDGQLAFIRGCASDDSWKLIVLHSSLAYRGRRSALAADHTEGSASPTVLTVTPSRDLDADCSAAIPGACSELADRLVHSTRPDIQRAVNVLAVACARHMDRAACENVAALIQVETEKDNEASIRLHSIACAGGVKASCEIVATIEAEASAREFEIAQQRASDAAARRAAEDARRAAEEARRRADELGRFARKCDDGSPGHCVWLCLSGDAEACMTSARMVGAGRGVSRDSELSEALLIQACDLGSAAGCVAAAKKMSDRKSARSAPTTEAARSSFAAEALRRACVLGDSNGCRLADAQLRRSGEMCNLSTCNFSDVEGPLLCAGNQCPECRMVTKQYECLSCEGGTVTCGHAGAQCSVLRGSRTVKICEYPSSAEPEGNEPAPPQTTSSQLLTEPLNPILRKFDQSVKAGDDPCTQLLEICRSVGCGATPLC